MKQENPYVISEFKNPSGKIVFQIYVRIDGKRFRKNFPTRAEAEAERQILDIQYLQETEMRVALAGDDDRVDDRGTLAGVRVPDEQPVLPAEAEGRIGCRPGYCRDGCTRAADERNAS